MEILHYNKVIKCEECSQRGDNVEKIRILRETKGITQQAMAAELNVDRSTVAKWELVGTYPRPRFLPMIARLLDCTIDELYDEKEVV